MTAGLNRREKTYKYKVIDDWDIDEANNSANLYIDGVHVDTLYLDELIQGWIDEMAEKYPASQSIPITEDSCAGCNGEHLDEVPSA
jgi:hypothetical protein